MLIIGMLISLSMFAQYGTGNKWVRFDVMSFPDFAVSKENRTYFVSVNVVKQVAGNYDADQVYNNINIPGWQKVDNEADAFLKVFIDIENFSIQETDVAIKEDKVKDGETTKTIRHYYGKIVYDMPYSVTIESPADRARFVREESKKVEWLSDERKSYEDAKKYIKDNLDSHKDKRMIAEVKGIVDLTISQLERKYAFVPKRDGYAIDYLDSKKSEYYQEQQTLISEVQDIVNNIKATSDIEAVAKDLQKYIDQFLAIIDKLSDSDKKQVKAKKSLIESVAKLYLIAENYEKSREYFSILVDKYQEKKMGNKIADIDQIVANLKKHNLQYRHFEY